MGDGMSGKGRSVAGNADHQSTAIFHDVVNTVRNSDSDGIGKEVVSVRRAVEQIPNGNRDF